MDHFREELKNWARWHARRIWRRYRFAFVVSAAVVILGAQSPVFAAVGALAVVLLLLTPRP